MNRDLLRVIADLPKSKQDAAIDSLVDAIIMEGLTGEEVEKLQLAGDDTDYRPDYYGRPN